MISSSGLHIPMSTCAYTHLHSQVHEHAHTHMLYTHALYAHIVYTYTTCIYVTHTYTTYSYTTHKQFPILICYDVFNNLTISFIQIIFKMLNLKTPFTSIS